MRSTWTPLVRCGHSVSPDGKRGNGKSDAPNFFPPRDKKGVTLLSNKTKMNLTSDPTTLATSFVLKAGLAQNLKGGVIMDVINAEQARIAEEAGMYFDGRNAFMS